jgi:hypothetical protein
MRLGTNGRIPKLKSPAGTSLGSDSWVRGWSYPLRSPAGATFEGLPRFLPHRYPLCPRSRGYHAETTRFSQQRFGRLTSVHEIDGGNIRVIIITRRRQPGLLDSAEGGDKFTTIGIFDVQIGLHATIKALPMGNRRGPMVCPR